MRPQASPTPSKKLTPNISRFLTSREKTTHRRPRRAGEEGTGFAPPGSVQIAEIDPGNSYPEVVVSFYTGGAHCCSDTSVVTSSTDGSTWKTVNIGQYD